VLIEVTEIYTVLEGWIIPVYQVYFVYIKGEECWTFVGGFKRPVLIRLPCSYILHILKCDAGFNGYVLNTFKI
jgi:hypothetical protein